MNYIVDFKNSLTEAEIDQYISDHGMIKLKEYSFFDRVYLISTDSEVSENEFIEKVIVDDHNGIQLLNVDISFVRNTSNEDTFAIQDNKNWWKTVVLGNVNFDNDTHTFLREGRNSTVYVLDSGIDVNHDEFQDTDVTLLYSVTQSFEDNNGHGTALASIISGKTCGVTNAKIKVVKIFDSAHNTLQSEMLAALDAVALDYSNNGKMPSVLNCSWGIPYNTYINDKIQMLINHGMYVVASAGNNGSPITDVTPACIPDVFTVGSFGQDLVPSNFSNYTDPSSITFTAGETNHGALDGWAPGEQIWAAIPNSTANYVVGTSASAAIASAAIAYNVNKFVNQTGINFTTFTNIDSYKSFLENNMQLVNKSSQNPSNEVYNNIALGKKDLLDLSDPKYNSSVNRIVGMSTVKMKSDSPSIQLLAQAGTNQYSVMYASTNITRITSVEDFPDYVTVYDSGLLSCNAPDMQDTYIINEIPITIYYDDTSTINQKLVIIVLRQDITYSNLENSVPENDPVLTITLNAPESCFNQGACGYDDCGPGYGCYGAPGATKYGCGCTYGSDFNLKENITLINTIDDINVYSFNYKMNNNSTLKGVMAQELLNTRFSHTVSKQNDGYYCVNYCLLPENIRKVCKLS